MTKRVILIGALVLSPVIYAAGKLHNAGAGNLRAVRDLNVNRFLGTWYEIASSATSYPYDCGSAIAQYNQMPNGKIQMLNICRKLQTGQVMESTGTAEIDDHASNSKMRVSYLPRWMQWTGLGEGQFWVIDIADDYSYAVVSEPGGHFVRILSRTSSISKETYDRIGDHLVAQDLPLDHLVLSRPNVVTAR